MIESTLYSACMDVVFMKFIKNPRSRGVHVCEGIRLCIEGERWRERARDDNGHHAHRKLCHLRYYKEKWARNWFARWNCCCCLLVAQQVSKSLMIKISVSAINIQFFSYFFLSTSDEFLEIFMFKLIHNFLLLLISRSSCTTTDFFSEKCLR